MSWDLRIRELLQEAEAASDSAMAAICRDAMTGDPESIRECVRVITDAEAMNDDDLDWLLDWNYLVRVKDRINLSRVDGDLPSLETIECVLIAEAAIRKGEGGHGDD